MRRGRGVARGAMMARRRTVRMVRRVGRRMRRRRRRRVILVGGMIGLGAYKLSKRDVQRVEEHTGKKAEELNDEELNKAMTDLNIPQEEMTDEELDYVDEQDPEEEDYIEQLERLSNLKDQGIITEEEFEAKKKQLLDL